MVAVFRSTRLTDRSSSASYTQIKKLRFYDSGTTDEQTVYSDSALSAAISQPISSDSAGVFPLIYMTTGTYRVKYFDADDVELYDDDAQDTGVPAGSAVAVADGGTGGTTATAARSNLGAASQSDVDDLGTQIATVQSGIDGLPGGALGDLAGKDEISRAELASSFGVVTLQESEVDSATSAQVCSTAMPNDNTIPQSDEGDEILTGSFTPISASSVLEIECYTFGAHEGDDEHTGMALFQDAGANAIAATFVGSYDSSGATVVTFPIYLKHRMNSPGTSSITFAVRAGSSNGTFNSLADRSGTRLGGGVGKAYIRVYEKLTV